MRAHKHGLSTGHYSEDKPFWAKLKECRLLTSSDCPKRVYHTALDVSGSGMKFLAGDSFTVHPSNHPDLVDALLQHLRIDGSQYDAPLSLVLPACYLKLLCPACKSSCCISKVICATIALTSFAARAITNLAGF